MSNLTVIIPTWNQCRLLESCLQSLARQTVSCRVLIVDDGSIDSTVSMLEQESRRFPFQLEQIRLERNLGFAKAANRGIQRSETDFIALLNNDTQAEEHWIETGLHAFSEFPDYSFFASRIVSLLNPDTLDSAGDGYTRTGVPFKRGFGEPAGAYPEAEPVLGAGAAAAFYRRRLFEEIGLFDEDFFMYLEDVDLSLRAQLAGHRCLYLPEAVVYHLEAASDPGRGDPDPIADQATVKVRNPPSRITDQRQDAQPYYSPRRVYWITRNRWQLMLTYQPVGYLPWLAYGWFRSFLFHLFKGGFLRSFLLGFLAGVRHTPRAFGKRLAVRRTATLSNQEFCSLLGKGQG